ncbi:MAG: histidinol-phosphate aminotransferase family protein [Chromatiales bacterium]|nr:histidinol-phosphate aminotransferase family protein [Chromatiales bacterium]
MTTQVSRRTLLRASSIALTGTLLAAGGTVRAGGHDGAARRPAGVRMAANENPYGPSAAARAAIRDSVEDIWQYAFGQEQALRRLIAEAEDLSPEHVLITAGSAEAIQLAGLVYGLERGTMVTARTTFTLTTDYAQMIGCKVVSVPLDDTLTHDLPAMAAAITPDTSLFYVCNPNNPTGTMVPGSELLPFVSEVARRTTVLVDEAYLDLEDDMAAHTAVPLVAAGEDVIVTRTFSKLHALAGLRIGYALAQPEVVARLENFRMGVLNLAGLRAAEASLQDREWQQLSRNRIRTARELTNSWIDELGLRRAASHGNFVFFDTRAPAADFAAAMRERGFLLGRPYADYPEWSRISLGTVDQMRAFADAARGYFAGKLG